jgi:class 3 adenylate cyclase
MGDHYDRGNSIGDHMTAVDLSELQSTLASDVDEELASTPEVIDVGHNLDVSKLAVTARRWHKATDVVSVVVDLKNSTQLGTGKWAASTASIYQAATGNIVRIFDEFDADFLQIQGDGVIGLFWGNRRYERAMCAGITVLSFSHDLVNKLEAKWDNLKDLTGYKVGVSNSRVLVKNVGTPRNPAQQEPIWAGKSVNYATKAAQSADRHELIVTGTVWDRISSNDYLVLSCSCGSGASDIIWDDFVIDRLPDDDPEAIGRKLISSWCSVHGAEYCTAILDGRKTRNDVTEARAALQRKHFKNAIWENAERRRTDRRARLTGLN